eukprot:TRINITY_DN11543_c0_g1_i6.p1 TRINITY_DN11543_c0_g1~~TRINITY_DN11543_c0_g1_i6.p1  ORF type:complete len:286 (+),score=67.24 TRINITY_DN11543_c0_g1_i6:33-890(+)
MERFDWEGGDSSDDETAWHLIGEEQTEAEANLEEHAVEASSSDDAEPTIFDLTSIATAVSLVLSQTLYSNDSIYAYRTPGAVEAVPSDRKYLPIEEVVPEVKPPALPLRMTSDGVQLLTEATNAETIVAKKSHLQPTVEIKEKEKKVERETAGRAWFNMAAPVITPEVANDLKALALRNYLDPKRHYKRDKTLEKIPKFFQMGTVISGPADTYSGRLNKAQRGETLVDELLADNNTVHYVKRKVRDMSQPTYDDKVKVSKRRIKPKAGPPSSKRQKHRIDHRKAR